MLTKGNIIFTYERINYLWREERGSSLIGIFHRRKIPALATQLCACSLCVREGEAFTPLVSVIYAVSTQKQFRIQVFSFIAYARLYYLNPPVKAVIIWALRSV